MIDMFDISAYSDSGQFDGQKKALADPCYLIRHPKGDFLWDTGWEQTLAETPGGLMTNRYHAVMARTLTDQLSDLGLKPADIGKVSISHAHPDHVGNANLFAGSTFIVNKAEYTAMFSEEARKRPARFKLYNDLEGADTILFETEHDVFGDGLVVIKSMPGHTPGHSALMLRLKNSGTLLFSGDLYIISESRDLGAYPSFNTDKPETVRSMKKFEALAKKENARVVIQHEKADFLALPHFPAYLD